MTPGERQYVAPAEGQWYVRAFPILFAFIGITFEISENAPWNVLSMNVVLLFLFSSPPLLPSRALPTNAWTCPACDTARGWLGIGPRSVWSGSEELPTPARPQSPPRGPPARPRAPRPHPGREPPVESRNRARERAAGPRGKAARLPRGKASERGGAGGGVSEGLERVLSKTGPRTKRNPRCELADRRRLLLLPWQAVSPQDSARVPSERASAARPGWSEVTA